MHFENRKQSVIWSMFGTRWVQTPTGELDQLASDWLLTLLIEHVALDSHPGAAFQDWFVNCGLSSLSSAPEVQNHRIKVGLLQTFQG